MTEVKKSKNSRTLLLLVVVFVLPVVLAKLALDNDYFNRGATNKGQLLDPVLDATSLYTEQENKWRIVYLLPASCQQACENAVYSVNQVWTALGKHSGRVEPSVILTESSDQASATMLEEYPMLKVLKADEQSVNKVFKDASTDGIFLMDTLGNVILRYPLYEQQEEAVMSSRDILADMRKLLKLSRIG